MPRGIREWKEGYHAIQRSFKLSDLCMAVSRGHLRTVQKIIKSGVDPNSQESTGITPLYEAIANRDVQMIEELIRLGADPKLKSLSESTGPPLIFAVKTSNFETVEVLLNNGADIYERVSDFEMTALHVSIDLRVTELLIERGLDVDVRDKYDTTRLHVAAQAGDTEMVELLIAKGADISATCTVPVDNKTKDLPKIGSNVTPLFLASAVARLDVIDVLIKAGVDVNVKTSENLTPLFCAVQYGSVEFVNKLLKAGAKRSVNVQSNPSGYTPLLLAAKSGFTDIVEALLQVEDIEVNPTSASMLTPLVVAASNGHLEIVKLLAAKNAPINSRAFKMMTPLHLALNAKKGDVAQFLIEHGADVSAADTTDVTPLHIACSKGISLEVIEALVEAGASMDARTNDDTTPLHLAAENDYQEIVEFLISRGADCNALRKGNWTALHCAASNGCLKSIAYLVSKVSNVNAASLSLITPLHSAVENDHQEVTKVLLKRGANVNAQDSNKRTPLHIAAEGGHLEIARLLLKFNALVNLKEETEECTPLFLAVKHQHANLVSLLLDRGAKVNAANKCGILPIHVAVKSENVGAVIALLGKGAYYNVEAQTENFCGTPLKFARKAKSTKIIVILEIIRKLFHAVIKNNTDQIKLCVQAGAILNSRKASGQTALHFAVSHSNNDAVKALLTGGADITLATNEGYLPFQIAVAKGCIEILETSVAHAKNLSIMRHSLMVNAKTMKDGDTGLHTAVENSNIHIVKFLLINGAIYNAKNNSGKMPLELITTDNTISSLLRSAEKLFKAVNNKDGLEEVLQLLENDNSIINARDADSGETPLYLSILKGHMDIAHALLSSGADYCLVTDKGTTPLHVAASESNIKIVLTIINHMKTDNKENFINAATITGSVALHMASNLEVVKCLLQAGAMHDIRNNEGKTALQLTRNDEVRRLLKATHKMFEDVEKGVFTVVNLLNGLKMEELKAVTNARNALGQTLIQSARINGHIKIANKLLEKFKRLG